MRRWPTACYGSCGRGNLLIATLELDNLVISPDGRELVRVTPDAPEETSARVTYVETLALPRAVARSPA